MYMNTPLWIGLKIKNSLYIAFACSATYIMSYSINTVTTHVTNSRSWYTNTQVREAVEQCGNKVRIEGLGAN